MQSRVTERSEVTGRTPKLFTWLARVLLVIGAWRFLQQFYFLRELFVFVGLAALVVFVGATLVMLGILLQEAVRGVLRYARKAQPKIAQQGEAYADGHSQAIGAPT